MAVVVGDGCWRWGIKCGCWTVVVVVGLWLLEDVVVLVVVGDGVKNKMWGFGSCRLFEAVDV
jgi:hypothetical protein